MDKRRRWIALYSALAMAALILDTKTALAAGGQGVMLCIQTLIPSLFPFFLISNLLTASLLGLRLRYTERLLRLPEGAGSLFLVGLLGGYPVGAQSVAQACRSGALPPQDAKRMLAFCSNAGPAFLFGIGVRIFPALRWCWLLWGIHILSAVLVGLLTPGGSRNRIRLKGTPVPSLTVALKKSVETMALVCGWVLLLRILLGFLQRWLLWLLPPWGEVFISGVLELANGCCRLPELGRMGERFTLCAVLLGFGGICVALQTRSVAGDVDTGLYLPGKITQAALSYLLCLPCMHWMPTGEAMALSIPVAMACGGICVAYALACRKIKKGGRNLRALGV